MRMKNPPHAGKLLKSELEALDLTITEAAEALDMTRTALSEIINGRRGISAKTAWKLSKAFANTSPEFWLSLQVAYDLAQVGEQCADNVMVLWNPLPLEDENGNLIEENVQALDDEDRLEKAKAELRARINAKRAKNIKNHKNIESLALIRNAVMTG